MEFKNSNALYFMSTWDFSFGAFVLLKTENWANDPFFYKMVLKSSIHGRFRKALILLSLRNFLKWAKYLFLPPYLVSTWDFSFGAIVLI